MNLNELLTKQKRLDKLVIKRVGEVEDLENKLKVSLLVELGELINEVPVNKYWKLSKNIKMEDVKEEWADCLHFALMIENTTITLRGIKNIVTVFDTMPEALIDDENDMNRAFLTALTNISVGNIEPPLITIIRLGFQLGFTEDIMIHEYNKKWVKNIERQKNNY